MLFHLLRFDQLTSSGGCSFPFSGLDDDAWPANQQEEHVKMGGKRFLEEFAVGLDEEALDRIAGALPAA